MKHQDRADTSRAKQDRMKLTKTEKLMFPELRAMMRRSRLIAAARIGDCDPATYAVRVQRLFTVGLKTFRAAK